MVKIKRKTYSVPCMAFTKDTLVIEMARWINSDPTPAVNLLIIREKLRPAVALFSEERISLRHLGTSNIEAEVIANPRRDQINPLTKPCSVKMYFSRT